MPPQHMTELARAGASVPLAAHSRGKRPRGVAAKSVVDHCWIEVTNHVAGHPTGRTDGIRLVAGRLGLD
jgi:hypothetical protein